VAEERRKNPAEGITRQEFNEFREVSDKYRCEQKKKLDNIHTALFAKDDQNEHGQVGLMVTASKIDKHITVVCNIFKWGLAGVTSLIPLIGAAKALGWL